MAVGVWTLSFKMAPPRMQITRMCTLLLALCLFMPLYSVSAADSEEPSSPVCRFIGKNSLSFCSMVNYVAVVDANDDDGMVADAKARSYFENVNFVLQRFGCNARYSLYTCDDCRDAYKYWVCSIKFQKCGQQSATMEEATDTVEPGTLIGNVQYQHLICTAPFPSEASSPPPCIEAISGRYRTCLSLCEDVVRKCPYVLNFQCPTSETAYFSTETTKCNKLDRLKNPDRPDQPWPGTFATA